ncbi:MAG TPA: S8 family peptidase, partial [Blastocatellia bacterium]|nr:S8 family peptidase [Blastocatellia bacterium]
EIIGTAGSRLERLDSRPHSGLCVARLKGQVEVTDAAARARRDPRVEFAEPNYLFYPAETVPDDSYFDQMWGLFNPGSSSHGGEPGADISATRAWDITTGSDDVVVAILDTGVELVHSDLALNSWVNPGEAVNGTDDDGDGFIDDINGWNFITNNNITFENASVDAHGTHVAGTIGALGNNGLGVVGVAWHVKLMSLKFIGKQPDGTVAGTTADAVRAIEYVIHQKRRGVNVRAINASWSGSANSRALREAITAAGDEGIVFVCAAGNGGEDGSGDDIDDPSAAEYPAAWSGIPSLISVAALDRSDGLADFSNYGHASVSVGAPGVSIMSTLPANEYAPDGNYGTFSGTSMAVPHVTGIIALLASHEPSLSAAAAKQRLIQTAQPIAALASKAVSSGRANAYNALTDTVPAAQLRPIVAAVNTSKKFVVVNGLGFLEGSSVIEVNGVALPQTRYDSSYSIANGTLTQLRAKLGKPAIRETFPEGLEVQVSVFNPTTGERSAPFRFTRH